jgi:hypothetical protein
MTDYMKLNVSPDINDETCSLASSSHPQNYDEDGEKVSSKYKFGLSVNIRSKNTSVISTFPGIKRRSSFYY